MSGGAPSGRAWRGDLARLLDAGLDDAAGVLGFELDVAVRPGGPADHSPRVPGASATAASDARDLAPTPLWRPVKATFMHPLRLPRPPDQPLDAVELRAEPGDLDRYPATPPTVCWPRLEGRLRRALSRDEPSRKVDLGRLVRRLARGELVARLPRRRWRAWPRHLVVWDTRPERLVNQWPDHEVVVARLRRVQGAQRLTVERPHDRALRIRLAQTGVPMFVGSGLRDTVVLLLGDAARGAEAAGWGRVAAALARHGSRLVALAPEPVPWAHHTVGWSEAPRTPASERAPLVERLLTLAAPAAILQPGLLRRLRLLVPGADAMVEREAMRHPDVFQADRTHVALRPEAQSRRRTAFFDEVHADLQERVRDELAAFHAALPVEVRHAETLIWASSRSPVTPPGDLDAALAFAHRLATSAGGAGTSAVYRKVLGRRLVTGLADGALRTELVGPVLTRVWAVSHDGLSGVPVPDGVDAAGIAVATGAREEARGRVVLWHRGGEIGVGEALPERATAIVGLEVGRRVIVTRGGRGGVQLAGEARLAVDEVGALEVETGAQRMVVERFVRPEWASAAGRDRHGLWVDMDLAGVSQRFRWIPPGRYVQGSPPDEQERRPWEGPQRRVTFTHGFWLADTAVTQALWAAVTGERPSHFRGDRRPVESVSWEQARAFAVEASARVPGGPGLRLPTEAEWEYACRAGTETATWRGPLEIRGENDAPGLDGLAWYGGNSGVDYPHDDGWDTSGWREKHHPETRAGTREVGGLEANPWGLYDMLGNVWEWCEDAWEYGAAYPEGELVDPPPQTVGANRVFRGGGWDVAARYVRAAFRYGDAPGYRHRDLGLRLAAGPWPDGRAADAATGEHSAEGAAQARDAPKRATGRARRRR